MANTAPGQKNDIETPVVSRVFNPGKEDLNLPLKSYPSSSKLGADAAKSESYMNSIESPAKFNGPYTKK